MIAAHSKDKFLTPVVFCDVCAEYIQGEGWAWVLSPRDGAGHLGETFFTHAGCQSRFEILNPCPPGWKWARLDIRKFLSLLADNTQGNPEKPPVIKVPRVH